MRRIATSLVAFVVALFVVAGVAHAHGGNAHLLGTVVQLHESHLIVKNKAGKQRTAELTPATKLEKAGKPATRADLVAGARVAVHFAANGKTALLVRISPAAPKPAAPK
ncbi:MAG TPA: hypothetical protein VGS57_03110 [Thermoanaerobaculia bacterium]|jgi:hypothetical protein|nr:hypothetical protein [Thermoanaerobaculia bacterium]